MTKGINGYSLTRKWFDFCFENPDLIRPSHSALYLYILDVWNRFGQKEKFGLPALHTMEAIGIKSKNTYYKTFYELVEFGFIKVIQKSINQNTANIISLTAISNFKSAGKSAHDSALIQQVSQQVSQQVEHSITSKQLNKETSEPFIVGNEKDREHFSNVPTLEEYQKYFFSYANNKYKNDFVVSRLKCDSLAENDFLYWESVNWERKKGKNKGVMKSIMQTIETNVRKQNTKVKDWGKQNQVEPPHNQVDEIAVCIDYASRKDWEGLKAALPKKFFRGVSDRDKVFYSNLANEENAL